MSLARRPILYGDARRWGLVAADCLELLPELPEASVDAVVTDPPYGIGFNHQAWDGRGIEQAARSRHGWLSSPEAFQRWSTAWAAEIHRVLKPGGFLVAFGATRTVHRLVMGLEDAGLEIRDQLLWLYGSGVPKCRRLEGDRRTTLKPAYEPIVLARAPLAGSLRDNLSAWGTGALQIGDGRIGDERRYPANVALSHESDCTPDDCARDCAVPVVDASHPTAPARFFYAAKAPRSEREAGCATLPKRAGVQYGGRLKNPRVPVHNPHPTVKPLDLMRWLMRLVCPPGGVVLDPFTGSGTSGAAALLEGRRFMGIEREPSYVTIARARIDHWGAVAEGRAT